MYQSAQDKADFLGRTASHATKGSKRGMVHDIPLSAVQALRQELEENEAKVNQWLSALPALEIRLRQQRRNIANLKKAAIANLNCYERRLAAGRKLNSHQLQRIYYSLTAALSQLAKIKTIICEIKRPGVIPCAGLGQLKNPVRWSGPASKSRALSEGSYSRTEPASTKGDAFNRMGTHGYGQQYHHYLNDHPRGDRDLRQLQRFHQEHRPSV